jgi:outer membrane protein
MCFRFPVRPALVATLALALAGLLPAQPAPAAPSPSAPAAPVTLRDLVLDALRANLEIQARRLDPQIQDSRLLTAWGAFDPVLSLSALREQSERAQNQRDFLSSGSIRIFKETNTRESIGLAGRVPNGLTYELEVNHAKLDNTLNRQFLSLFHPEYQSVATLRLTQPLLRDFGTEVGLAEVRLTENARRVSAHEFRAAVLKIVGQVMAAYFEAVFAQENVRVKEQAIALAQDLVRENTRRVEEGRMSPIDITQAQARLAEAREERILAASFLGQRRNTLRELTKADFDSRAPVMTFAGGDVTLPVPALDRDTLTGETLGRNPSYLSAIEQAKAEDIRVAYAKNQRWPRVDLKATLGDNGLGSDFGDSLDDFSDRDHPDWSAGLVISIPLTGRAAAGRLAEARHRKTQAALNLKRTEVILLSALDTAVRDIEAAQERLALVKDSVRLAESALDAEQRRLASGTTTSYNVLTLQRDLSQARSRELATVVDLNKAVATLWLVQGVLAEKMDIVIAVE